MAPPLLITQAWLIQHIVGGTSHYQHMIVTDGLTRLVLLGDEFLKRCKGFTTVTLRIKVASTSWKITSQILLETPEEGFHHSG